MSSFENWSTPIVVSDLKEDDDTESVLFKTLKGSALVLLVVWTIAANSLVFVVLYKNPRLQTVPNLLVGNLAFSDICLSILVLPFSTVYAIGNQWYFGRYFCEVWLSGDILCCTASIWNMSTIGLDRYWAITSPVTYMNKRNKRTAFTMIGLVWLLAIMVSLAPFLGWRAAANRGNHVFDPVTNTTQCMFMDLPAYTIYSATGSFFVPSILMFFVYYKIYMAFADHRARQIYRQKVIRRHIESTILHEISHVLPTSDEFARSEDDDKDEDEDDGIEEDGVIMNGVMSTNAKYASSPRLRELPELAIMEEEEDDENEATAAAVVDEQPDIQTQINTKKNSCTKRPAGPPIILGSRGLFSKRGFQPEPDPSSSSSACQQQQYQQQLQQNSSAAEKYNDEGNDDENDDSGDPIDNTNNATVINDQQFLRSNNDDSTAKNSQESLSWTAENVSDNHNSRNHSQNSTITTTTTTTTIKPDQNGRNHNVSLSPSKSAHETTTMAAKSTVKISDDKNVAAAAVAGSVNRQQSSTKSPNQVRRVNQRGKPLTFERVQRHKNRAERRAMLRRSLQNKPPAISASKEKRGVKVLGIILGCFTVCWTPFFVMYLVGQFCTVCRPNVHIEHFITWLSYSNSAMNPIIYTVFNRDYQNALRRLFTKRKR